MSFPSGTAAAALETHLLNHDADLSQVGRISSAFQHDYEVASLLDVVAGALTEEPAGELKPEAVETMSRFGWVYALTTWDCEVVYIGMTTRRLPDRMRDHCRSADSPLNKRVTATGKNIDLCFGWNVGDSARRYESAAILLMQPIHNVKGMKP